MIRMFGFALTGTPAKRTERSRTAKKLGIAQPRVSEITRNKIDKVSLDYLVGLCSKAGLTVKMRLAAQAKQRMEQTSTNGHAEDGSPGAGCSCIR